MKWIEWLVVSALVKGELLLRVRVYLCINACNRFLTAGHSLSMTLK